MAVESPVTYISDLNASYPGGGEDPAEGDDHIRNIKTAIKGTFPNIDAAVTSTEDELNLVDGSSAGTAVASKAAIYGSKKQLVAFNYSTTEYDAGNSGTAKTIDFDNGVNQKLALTGNVAITLSNPLAGQTSKLKITQGASAYTVTFSTTVKWPAGVAYTASAGNGAIDIVTLYYDGSAWYGQYATGFA